MEIYHVAASPPEPGALIVLAAHQRRIVSENREVLNIFVLRHQSLSGERRSCGALWGRD